MVSMFILWWFSLSGILVRAADLLVLQHSFHTGRNSMPEFAVLASKHFFPRPIQSYVKCGGVLDAED